MKRGEIYLANLSPGDVVGCLSQELIDLVNDAIKLHLVLE
ncbi:hypothetical protein NIES806_19510 [Dolichospermum compactum NIES-806]|uniref:Uncharacterized protein n=1 Tax=Dolichospermum compactum NIES-806 TaxID=1973481 RepID=A0A1Z4V2N9_9CYAN|nr:hypothetical protein NIES806_19510 [Dolichospermum compactum NIES-806]